MATTIPATWQVVEDYQTLFVNRQAYTMRSLRPHPEKITVGLYAINPSTQRCKWVAIDADYKMQWKIC